MYVTSFTKSSLYLIIQLNLDIEWQLAEEPPSIDQFGIEEREEFNKNKKKRRFKWNFWHLFSCLSIGLFMLNGPTGFQSLRCVCLQIDKPQHTFCQVIVITLHLISGGYWTQLVFGSKIEWNLNRQNCTVFCLREKLPMVPRKDVCISGCYTKASDVCSSADFRVALWCNPISGQGLALNGRRVNYFKRKSV